MTGKQIKDAVASVLTLANLPDLSSPTALIANLIFLYHTSIATENLLKLASDHSTGCLKQYFLDHLEEERDHDKWLADDLASVGIDVSQTIVPRQAVEMIGSQYYLIQHMDACALLGYLVWGECFPAPIEHIELMESIHGKTLLRNSRHHAVHDIAHGDDVLAVIDQLSEREKQIVLQTAVQSAHYFIAAINQFR